MENNKKLYRCDIGCGGGNRPATGYDVYTDIFEPGTPIPGKFILCPMENMPFKDKEFDYARCHHVIEHTTDPGRACSELVRIAKGGIISFPPSQAELMFGRKDHGWFVFVDKGRLLFVAKRHPSYGVPRKETGCELNVDFHWKDKFEWKVVGMEDNMLNCSAIVPCCNEYPQVLFTVQSLLNEGVDEVIVISNKSTDKTNVYFGKLRNPRVKFFIKDDILSHWQAKNLGIEKSRGGLLFFCDSHCILERGSIDKLREFVLSTDAVAHCLIKYMLDPKALEYKFQPEKFGYRFCGARKADKPYQVSVMSTCGMMVRRSAIERFGGWNTELGIYGGGEQYINFKHGVCGYPHYIHPEAVVWHYAEKRGYSYNYNDFVRNQFIAAYCVGGEELLKEVADERLAKDRPLVIQEICEDVRQKCKADRDFIESKQKIDYSEFVGKWAS